MEKEKNDIIYRDATVWDAYAIADMWKEEADEVELFGRTYNKIEKEKFFINIIAKIYEKSKGNLILIIEKNKETIGFVLSYPYLPKYGYNGYIGFTEAVYIKKKHRGGGLFDDIIDYILNFFRKIEIKQVEFQTNYSDRLFKIYKRKGFVPSDITFRKEISM